MLGDASCRLALQLLGYVYPAYKTYKVVQLPATRSNDTLLRKWCCYWCLMACFTAVAPVADTLLFFLPLYYEAKLALAIYLWANELAGTQHVWARWFQPLVASYEPLVDRKLAESKALASDWLHSNTMRLAALAQAKLLSWLQAVQLQAAQAAGGGRVGGGGVVVEEVDLAQEEEVAVVRRRRASAPPAPSPSRRAAARGATEAAGKGGEQPPEPLEPRSSSFGLAAFFSARSADLQQQDLRDGLKAFPILAASSPEDRH